MEMNSDEYREGRSGTAGYSRGDAIAEPAVRSSARDGSAVSA